MIFSYRKEDGYLNPYFPAVIMLFVTVVAFLAVPMNESTYQWFAMNSPLQNIFLVFVPYLFLMFCVFLWSSVITNINNRNDFNTKQQVPLVRFTDIFSSACFSLMLTITVFMATSKVTPVDEIVRSQVIYKKIMEIDDDHYSLPLIQKAVADSNWPELVSLVRRFQSETKPENAIALRVIAASVKNDYEGYQELQKVSSSRYISSQDFEDQILKLSRAPEAIKNDNANAAMAISKIIGINGRG
jgi:hypothetical protein